MLHIQYSKKKKAIEIDKSIEKSTNDQTHKKYTIDFITDGIFFQLDQKIYTCKRLICFLKINENILQSTPKFFVLNDDTLLLGQSSWRLLYKNTSTSNTTLSKSTHFSDGFNLPT